MQENTFFVKNWKPSNSNFPCIHCKQLVPQGTKCVWLSTIVPEAAEQIREAKGKLKKQSKSVCQMHIKY